MKQYTYAVIDDEQICRDNVIKSMQRFPELALAGVASTSAHGLELLLNTNPDLLFLDVELPDKTGLDFLRDLRDRISWPMKVVFYTAFEKYMLEALRESAFDFLVKPYAEDEFDDILKRYFREMTSDLNLHEGVLKRKTFAVSTITGCQVLDPNNIVYFEYQKQKKYWQLYLVDGNEYSLKRNAKAEDILAFFGSLAQVNQYQIINIDYLACIDGKNCMLLPPFDHLKEFSVSRTFVKSLQDRLSII